MRPPLQPTIPPDLFAFPVFFKSNSLLISISVSPSLFPPVPLSSCLFFFLLIKQRQTGFVALVQIGVNTSPTLEKSPERQENRCQVSDCKGRTPLLWGPGRKHRHSASADIFLGEQGPFLLPHRGHCHQAGTRLVPGRSIQQPWAVAASS